MARSRGHQIARNSSKQTPQAGERLLRHHSTSRRRSQPPEEIELGDADRGQQVFFQNGCNVCHGDTGEGGIGPTLAQTGFSVEQVIDQYRKPRGTMPAFNADTVSDQQVADVHAWLQTLPLPDTIIAGEGTP